MKLPADIRIAVSLADVEKLFRDTPGSVAFVISTSEAAGRIQQAIADGMPTSRDLHEFYEQLDPGIREVVRYLRREGFITTDSGDGKTKPPGPDVLPYPHVVVEVATEQMAYWARRLQTVMTCGEAIDKLPRGWQVQLTYDPATDHTRTVVMVTWPVSVERDG